ILRDSPLFIAAFLGAVKIGAIPVPLSTLARPEELALMERDSDAAMTVTDADADFLSGRPGPIETAPTSGDDMCFWQYSSGTTGAPKAVIHLHRPARRCRRRSRSGGFGASAFRSWTGSDRPRSATSPSRTALTR